MKRYYRRTPAMVDKMKGLLSDLYAEFGWKTRLVAPVIGLYAYVRLLREQRRLARGWHYEPTSFYEKNSWAEEAEIPHRLRHFTAPDAMGTLLAPPKPALRP
jgi:hypothetical protein